MLKTSLLSLLFVLFFINLSAQKTYVPDDNFEQALISLGYDDALNDSVTTANISEIYSLTINDKNISDLTGVEDFANLHILFCNDNQLTVVDVSSNTKLIQLFLYNNQLVGIDVSKNTELFQLGISNNHIKTIDVNNNSKLELLSCNSNNITYIDVNNNPALTVLSCSDNQIISIAE